MLLCPSDVLTYSIYAQPWPAELPLISTVEYVNGTAKDELDMGVVLYSCSFVVISLMILSQVQTSYGQGCTCFCKNIGCLLVYV